MLIIYYILTIMYSIIINN